MGIEHANKWRPFFVYRDQPKNLQKKLTAEVFSLGAELSSYAAGAFTLFFVNVNRVRGSFIVHGPHTIVEYRPLYFFL